jgi:PleD family two-component response regulator
VFVNSERTIRQSKTRQTEKWKRPLSGKNRNIRGRERKVLVLDDDFDLATLVKQILQKDGFENVFAFTDPFVGIRTL